MMAYARLFGILTVFFGFCVPNATHASTTSNYLLFMQQMRCTNGIYLPGDAQCTQLQPIAEGAEPGYRLSNGMKGANRIDVINIPITRHGKTLYVSPIIHTFVTDPQKAGGVSIQGPGGQFLTMLSSWSPIATSVFVNNSWVLGPLAGSNAYFGRGVTWGANQTSLIQVTSVLRLRATAFTWEHKSYAYASGRTFDSMVSVHYSAASADGFPRTSEQRERIYLAYGLGLARWEKWSRADWYNDRTHRTALAEGQAVFASHRCNMPIRDVDQGDGMRYGAVTATDVYAEKIQAGPNEPVHNWYLTKCEDYTHLIPGPTLDLRVRAQQADDGLWK